MGKVLFQKIQRLKEELIYLKTNKDRFVKSLRTSIDIKKIVERSAFLCAEMVLDIADLIIVKKGYPKPATYREAIYNLGEFKIIPEEFAYNFVYIAGLRNFLAHEYLKETMPTLEDFLNNKMADIEKFLKLIEENI
ncbi:MAG: DUF86 domain-containing protein [Nitrospirota bacterium]